MELLEALSESFDHANKVVGGVQPDQLDAATPCTEWDVRALLGHTVGVVVNMGRGASGSELLPSIEGFQIDTADPGTQFRTESDRTLAAWSTRADDDEVNVGAGPMPAKVALGINLLDTATHSWDVARATGQDANLPDALAMTVLGLCQGFITDDLRQYAGFDPAVAIDADASPTDQLVAFLGRRP